MRKQRRQVVMDTQLVNAEVRAEYSLAAESGLIQYDGKVGREREGEKEEPSIGRWRKIENSKLY